MKTLSTVNIAGAALAILVLTAVSSQAQSVNQPPSVTCPPAGTIECGSTVEAMVADSDGDALTVVWALNGVPVQTNTLAAGTATTSTPVSLSGVFPLGDNSLAVSVTDIFGNGASCSTTLNVVDSTPLICPTNMSVCNSVGQCGAVVTYPVATGDCGTGAVVCVPPSGSFFPVGTTTVTCTAPDGTNCSFTITVGLCTTNCPLTQGLWKSHPAAWPVSTLQLGTVSYTEARLLTILATSTGSGGKADASLILADQLIAAKLNLANGSDPCPILAIIAAADALIGSQSIPIVPKITPNTAVGAQMVALAAALNSYNQGLLTPNCAP